MMLMMIQKTDWNVSILDFIGAKDDGDVGDNWSYKTCKAPVDKPTPIALGQLWTLSELRMTEMLVTTGVIRRAKLQLTNQHPLHWASSPPSSLAPITSGMETFWYRLTLGKWLLKRRQRGPWRWSEIFVTQKLSRDLFAVSNLCVLYTRDGQESFLQFHSVKEPSKNHDIWVWVLFSPLQGRVWSWSNFNDNNNSSAFPC